ncbi:helix-turn-helix transcriptional regulator [Parvularcula sp. LCG005]|uniref:helix-turn-helix domain-containing protein n=1 Tax=Parvularcula sp. LCG005 TaxID=3078805 RepID=UPI0029422EA6|nr:helix-turn-helix transcriptional regulator [Parvularcula sp. LCG005]WOI54189.1 helix-turn-helix transcriptional regulator [Parvularcula sp. LCG005]
MKTLSSPPTSHDDISQPRQVSALDRLIGQQVRSFREAKGLSQQDLAGQCGVSFQQLQKYERGVNRLPAARLHQLASSLDRPIAAFFNTPDEAQVMHAALQDRLRTAIVELDTRTLQVLVDLVDRLHPA